MVDYSFNSSFFLTALIALSIVPLILWFWSRKGHKGISEGKEFFEGLMTAGLIRYGATSRFEGIALEAVKHYVSKGRFVLFVSSASRAEGYLRLFEEDHEREKIMLVKVSASPRTDRFFLTNRGEKKKDLKGSVAEISVDWLEYLTELIEEIPKQSVLVFEPLSDLVLINGFEKTFKFIKKTIDYCVSREILMISFINNEAHEENVKASFEGLFTNIAAISEEKLKIVK